MFVSVQNLERLGLPGGGKYLAAASDRIHLVGITVDKQQRRVNILN